MYIFALATLPLFLGFIEKRKKSGIFHETSFIVVYGSLKAFVLIFFVHSNDLLCNCNKKL